MDLVPVVFGGSEKCLRRFDMNPNVHDKGYHNQGVHKAVLCKGNIKEGKKLAVPISYILSVDNVAEGFLLYSLDGS